MNTQNIEKMKSKNRQQLIEEINRKLKRVNREKLKEIIENLKPKEDIDYEYLQGTFKSKETGKVHMMMARPKINLGKYWFTKQGDCEKNDKT